MAFINDVEQVFDRIEYNFDLLAEAMISLSKKYHSAKGYKPRFEKLFVAVNKKHDEVEQLRQEIDSLKSSIILDRNNANRSGRPSLLDKNPDIVEYMKELRREGRSYRKIAFEVGCSCATVHKYAKRQAVD